MAVNEPCNPMEEGDHCVVAKCPGQYVWAPGGKCLCDEDGPCVACLDPVMLCSECGALVEYTDVSDEETASALELMKRLRKEGMPTVNPDGTVFHTYQIDKAYSVLKMATGRLMGVERAVSDAAIVNHMWFDRLRPKKSLNELICAEVAIALDPRVSKEAADLVKRGRMQERRNAKT